MIVKLYLTPEQQALVPQASSARENAIFIATAAPHNGAWRLQMATISGATDTKMLRLIKAEYQQREAAHTAC